MRNFLKSNNRKSLNSRGFTIVELITVIVVMGILSSAVILSYNSWKQSTITAQLKSDLNNVAMAMENARNFNDVYPGSIPSTVKASEGVTLYGGSVDGSTYCVHAASDYYDDLVFHITSSNSSDFIDGACP